MRKRTIVTLTAILLAATTGFAESIVFGQEDGWLDVAATENLVLKPGRQGYPDYQLMLQRYEADEQTELLLQFDDPSLADTAGRYRVVTDTPEIGTTTHRTGSAALLVDRRGDEVELFPQPGALLRPGVEWGSFTIEFWLYPVFLTDGDTILDWFAHEGADKDFREQRVNISVQDRRLLFSFRNFFQTPEGEPYTVTLQSPRNPIPRRWSHHMVRFDDETALLEYVVDGVPVAITHATASGTEDGSVYFPRTALYPDGGLRLPGEFIGAIDELRITREFVEEPNLELFPRDGGRLTTSVVDLGSTGARVLSINSTVLTPGMSDVFLYYRLGNIQFANPGAFDDPGWVPFRSGDSLSAVTGRFLQVKAELFADTATGQSPSLSEITIDYVPDPPPLPPTGVAAEPQDGAVVLRWSPVHEQDVAGYLVYYGDQSGRYFGSESSSGVSPIDVGLVNSVVLEGLTNGVLYYFAVSAYDTSRNTVGLQLSSEVAARPARVYR